MLESSRSSRARRPRSSRSTPGDAGDSRRQGDVDHGRAMRAPRSPSSRIVAARRSRASTGAGPTSRSSPAAVSRPRSSRRSTRSPRYSFAGSDQLALQIRQGSSGGRATPAASPKYPQLALSGRSRHEAGRLRDEQAGRAGAEVEPRRAITSVYDLRRSRVKVVIGDRGVPIGAYTRQLLRRARHHRRGDAQRRQRGDRRQRHREQGRTR